MIQTAAYLQTSISWAARDISLKTLSVGEMSVRARQKPQTPTGSYLELGEYGFVTEVERLRRDCSVLAAEIIKLRKQQNNCRSQLLTMKEQLQHTERKQRQAMEFLARATECDRVRDGIFLS